MAERAGFVLKVLAADGGVLRRFRLPPGEHLVGSAPEAAIQLTEGGVSRRHAQVRVLADGGAVIKDLGSKNGTSVAGRRIGEAATTGLALVSFGPVQGLLQPAEGEDDEMLFRVGKGPVPRSTAEESGAERSTHGADAASRAALALEAVLPALAAGELSPATAAQALAEALLEQLPFSRVELVKSTGGEERVLAAAGSSGRLPGKGESIEIAGAGELRWRLRAPAGLAISRVAPLLRLALAILTESRARASFGTGAPEPTRSPVLLPPGLGRELSRLYRRAGKVARGTIPVLILGESGVGKEVMAHFLHHSSPRRRGTFLAVNCAAFPAELLEAELFGIEKGVATGVEARAGILERAAGGTVFLDEVGDMALATQAKVLRVLESTHLTRVGGKRPIDLDVRFVAATHRDLAAMVAAGSFRSDLFHRLAGFEAHLPPLRQRREEIPALAARFFHHELVALGAASPGMTRAALAALVRYRWPGNVRELKLEVAKATLLLEPGEALDVHHLSTRLRPAGGAAPTLTLEQTVEEAEREAFAVALAASEGDPTRAMELLAVSKTTYYRKLKELGLG